MNRMHKFAVAFFLSAVIVAVCLAPAKASPALEASVKQNIEIDRSDGASDIAYVRLYGRNPNGVSPGHAYIEIFDKSVDGKWRGRGKLGFYPQSTVSSVYTFMSDEETKGVLAFDAADANPSYAVTIRINKSDVAKVNAVIDQWQNKPYDGYSSDCVTFVAAVATALGLRVPARDKSDYPRTFVIKIGEANK